MDWTINFQLTAKRELANLAHHNRQRIVRYFRDRVRPDDNPYRLAKALDGPKGRLARFYIGDYQAICLIREDRREILVLSVGPGGPVFRVQ